MEKYIILSKEEVEKLIELQFPFYMIDADGKKCGCGNWDYIDRDYKLSGQVITDFSNYKNCFYYGYEKYNIKFKKNPNKIKLSDKVRELEKENEELKEDNKLKAKCVNDVHSEIEYQIDLRETYEKETKRYKNSLDLSNDRGNKLWN